ncbi:hypothetical protein [Virgibacillus doumboii]|uniref:hypothetical protein n=1 Tax=Virgibacillus doumboii TaxID=2697503 RepID=UPI0013DF3563|nr:hypothetical protein [Virgibacillus doumboii]
MENKLKIKKEINQQEVILDLIVNGTNDYILKTKESGEKIVVRELARKRKAIILYKPLKIAGVMVKEIEITDEQLNVIEEIEKEFKQKAIDRDKQSKEDLINGVTTIKVNYRSGKALSGYIIFGHEADLLKSLGVAKEIGGWRTIVDEELIEALGEEFTYQQASDYAKPVVEEREKEKAKKEAKIKAKMEEAKRTGEKVAIRRWQENCNNSRKDCDLDNMTEYALPDGKTKIERRHTGLKV